MNSQNRKAPLPYEIKRSRGKTPLKLRRLVIEHDISQSDLCDVVVLDGGRAASPATISQILSRDIWPRRTSKQLIKEQLTALLKERGIAADLIAQAFEIDDAKEPVRKALRKSPRTDSNVAPIDVDQLPEKEMLSQKARQHFKLFRDPFVDDVQGPDDVFLSDDQRYTRETMFQAARNGSFVAIIGESGAGKSTLRRDLSDRIHREGQPICLIQPRIIDKSRMTAGAICDAIVQDISQENPKRSLEAKGRQVEKLLTNASRAGMSHALVIEEAHDLGIHTIKYLKRFWEIEDGFKHLLGIILIGQPELKGKLDERQNWDAREVIRRCEVVELRPLDGHVEKYLALKLKRAGKALDQLFEDDVYSAIQTRLTVRRRGVDQTVSMQYPLVINNLITKALNACAEMGASKVSAEQILEV